MKTKTEIYSIRFNHIKTDKDIFCTTYTVGAAFLAGSKLVIPLKITFDKDGKHITTYFDDKTSHSIYFAEDVEIFKRIIDAKETQNTDDKRGV
jgi:hypothetical protein